MTAQSSSLYIPPIPFYSLKFHTKHKLLKLKKSAFNSRKLNFNNSEENGETWSRSYWYFHEHHRRFWSRRYSEIGGSLLLLFTVPTAECFCYFVWSAFRIWCSSGSLVSIYYRSVIAWLTVWVQPMECFSVWRILLRLIITIIVDYYFGFVGRIEWFLNLSFYESSFPMFSELGGIVWLTLGFINWDV